MRIRNGINPSPWFGFIQEILLFRNRLVIDSSARRIQHELEQTSSQDPTIYVFSLQELGEFDRAIMEAPADILEFNTEQATALWNLMALGNRIRSVSKSTTFLAGIAPSPESYQAWTQMLQAGYFNN
jgi:hypothetical protein